MLRKRVNGLSRETSSKTVFQLEESGTKEALSNMYKKPQSFIEAHNKSSSKLSSTKGLFM